MAHKTKHDKRAYIECVDPQWFDDCGRLLRLADEKTLTRIERTAIRSGAQVIRKGAQKELLRVLPEANHRSRKYNDTLMEGVLISTKKTKGVEAEGKVHIMGTRSKGSGTFRLRFFEVGTTRTRKDGGTYGIDPSKFNFFKRSATANQGKAARAMEQSLIKQINREFDK